jgi:methyl-accepting chemotaxis protein-1 (serine sensor receptor)
MKTWKIATRLQWIIGILGCLLVGIGSLGLQGLAASNASLKTVYEDRVIALGQLGEVSRLLQRNRIVLLDSLVHREPAHVKQQTDEFDRNTARIESTWKAYEATYLTIEESALAKEFPSLYRNLMDQGLRPMRGALANQDHERADQFYQTQVAHLMAPVMENIDQLNRIQFAVSKQEYESGLANFTWMRAVSISAILGGLGIAIALGYFMIRSLYRQLGGEPSEVLAITTAVAQGDLTTAIAVPASAPDSVMAGMARMQHALQIMVGTVREGSESVASGSTQIASGSGDLSSRTERQASALEQTAASMEQLSATVRQNADSAREAYRLSNVASGVARKGGDVVAQVVDTMQGIDQASQRIADIIGVIDGIAFQTNILALNAAVEAARAGEQGRGFAVVASEVRSLAGRSADAAKEIKGLISASVERVALGSDQVQQAGGTMKEVVLAIQQVADLMDSISAASSEQASGVSQIGEAVGHMDQTTQQNAALVEEMSAAAASLRARAHELVQSVAAFRLHKGGSSPLRQVLLESAV